MSNTAPRQPLTENDWNFSASCVPDSELIPCLLWEFLRESATARQLANDWIEWFGRQTERCPVVKNGADAKLLWPRTQAIKLTINYPVLLDDFNTMLGMAWGSERMANVPWQALSRRAKAWMRWPCAHVNQAPVFIGNSEHALCLNTLVNDPNEEAVDMDDLADRATDGDCAAVDLLEKELAKRVVPARALLPSFTKPWKSLPNSMEKQEALCVVVDWGRYDDNAVRDGFKKLAAQIIKTRPKGIAPQVLRKSGLRRDTGQKSEWRGKLRDLGRARLYCYYNGMDHLERKNPGAYKWIADNLGNDKGHRAVMKSLSDAKARFVTAFRKILPFEKRPPLCLGTVKSHRRISK